MFVSCVNSICKVYFVVAHAPFINNKASKIRATEWWAQHRRNWQKCIGLPGESADVFWLGDANASATPFGAAGVGEVGTRSCNSSSNRAGDLFSKFVGEQKLLLPGTWTGSAEYLAKPGTFAINGEEDDLVQLDHIACFNHTQINTKSYAKTNFVAEPTRKKHRVDHLLVSVSVTFSEDQKTKVQKRRTCDYDRKGPLDPTKRDEFAGFLRALPPVPCGVEPTSHQHIIDDWIRTLAKVCFPKVGVKPRQAFVSSWLVGEITAKNELVRKTKWLSKCVANAGLRATFKVWAGHWKWPNWSWRGFVSNNLKRNWVKGHNDVDAKLKQNRSIVKLERLAFLDKNQERADNAVVSGNLQAINMFVSDCKPKTNRATFMMQKLDGTIAANIVESQLTLQGHFGKVLCGTPKRFEQIVAEDFELEKSKVETGCRPCCFAKSVTTPPTGLKMQIATAKPKALSEDGLGAELGQAVADEIKTLYHPLCAKVCETAWVPTYMRGGHLFSLYKGRGAQNAPKQQRDITIAMLGAKYLGRDVRDKTVPFLKSIVTDTQYGAGLNGGCIAIGTLHLKAFADTAHKKKLVLCRSLHRHCRRLPLDYPTTCCWVRRNRRRVVRKTSGVRLRA